MSDSEDAPPPSEQQQQASGSASRRQMRLTTSHNIGYCHVCDKQVEIDEDHFSCSECHGGFVELFELAGGEGAEGGAGGAASAAAQVLTSQALGGETNILPFLLSQMLNPHAHLGGGGGASANPASRGASMTIQRSPPNLMMPLNRTTSESGTAASRTTSSASSSGPAGQAAGRHGQQTRVQLIVPGEQFDLYGIINTVLQDILDPSRQQNAQIHFHQAPPMRMFQLHGDLRDYAWGASGLDTIITQLLNQLENSGPPPASENQLHNLPEITIGQEEVEKNMQCSICMDDFALNDKAKRLPCKHLFHEPCIVEWLKLHGTCPVCRKNLVGEDTSQHEYVRPPDTPGAPGSASEEGSGGTQASTSASGSQAAAPASAATAVADDSNSQRRNPPPAAEPDQPVHDMEFD